MNKEKQYDQIFLSFDEKLILKVIKNKFNFLNFFVNKKVFNFSISRQRSLFNLTMQYSNK